MNHREAKNEKRRRTEQEGREEGRKKRMFEDGLVASTEAFMACVLTLSLAVAVHIAHGMGTIKAKEAFVGGFLLLMVCAQCYYLIESSTYIPYFPYTYNGDLRRYDCVDSGKGGKRPGASKHIYDQNPCYCHASAVCTLFNDTVLSDPTACPLDGATCTEGTGIGNFTKRNILPYINNDRNCLGGAGVQCSKEQPCDPCDRSSLHLYGRKSLFTNTKTEKKNIQFNSIRLTFFLKIFIL